MSLPLYLLGALAQVSPTAPIVVTAHPWAPFISPMGEPFRAHSATDDTLANWFAQADANHDGILTAAEMKSDAEHFFTRLDSDHDGEIDPDELAQYEYEVAPEIQVMSRTRRAPGQPTPAASKADADQVSADGDGDGGRKQRRARAEQDFASLGLGGALQGAARYSLLNMPEPVAAADTDFNRSITLEEFRAAALARFQLLDTARQGRLSLAQLEAIPHVPKAGDKRLKINDNATDTRIGNPLPKGP